MGFCPIAQVAAIAQYRYTLIRSRKDPVMPPRDATQQAQAAPPAKRVLLLTSEDLADANEVPKPLRPLIEEAEDIYVLARH
jgi:hypothetical protein